jgi:hypothetical protein
MKKARLIPMGARNFPLCFSTANIKIVNTNPAVRNISINNPLTVDVPGPSFVCTIIGPGKRHDTTAADAIDASSCATNITKPLIQDIAPMRHIPKATLIRINYGTSFSGEDELTAGLNNPPLIR